METVLTAENATPEEVAKPDGEATDTGSGESASPATKVGTSEDTSDWTEKAQKRYHELTRERYDALRERDIERYEKEQLKQRLEQLEKAKTPEVAPPESFPTLEQFDYDQGKFMAAVHAYTKGMTETAKAAAREAAQEIVRAEREAQAVEQSTRSWAKKEAEFIKVKPDYVEKVLEATTLPISREMQMELRDSEYGPQIAYYLVENPEKAAAIMALPIKAQYKEIAKIEGRLESTKTPTKPAVSQAPPPISKVDGNEAKVEKEPADMSDAEFAKWRKRQIAARRG